MTGHPEGATDLRSERTGVGPAGEVEAEVGTGVAQSPGGRVAVVQDDGDGGGGDQGLEARSCRRGLPEQDRVHRRGEGGDPAHEVELGPPRSDRDQAPLHCPTRPSMGDEAVA